MAVEMNVEKGDQSDGDLSSGSDSENEEDFDLSKNKSHVGSPQKPLADGGDVP